MLQFYRAMVSSLTDRARRGFYHSRGSVPLRDASPEELDALKQPFLDKGYTCVVLAARGDLNACLTVSWL